MFSSSSTRQNRGNLAWPSYSYIIARESGNRKITIYISFPGGEDLFSDDALQCNFLFYSTSQHIHTSAHIALCISSVWMNTVSITLYGVLSYVQKMLTLFPSAMNHNTAYHDTNI